MARALTVEQASEYLQLSPYTVRLWLREGKLPGRKIGRSYRILDTDLEAFLAARPREYENPVGASQGAVRETAPKIDYGMTTQETLDTATRANRIRAVKGMFAGAKRSVDDFLREKHKETDAEEQRKA
jgi:excisionase family DNA binding protein